MTEEIGSGQRLKRIDKTILAKPASPTESPKPPAGIIGGFVEQQGRKQVVLDANLKNAWL